MSDYDTDFYTWTQDQAAALRARAWKTLDLDNLAEEADELRDSPSLRSLPASLLSEVYLEAREDAAEETGLPITRFPNICRWSVDEVLNPDFLPDTPESAGRGSATPRGRPGPRRGPRRA